MCSIPCNICIVHRLLNELGIFHFIKKNYVKSIGHFVSVCPTSFTTQQICPIMWVIHFKYIKNLYCDQNWLHCLLLKSFDDIEKKH